jgi:hypothetical protein
MAMIAFSNSIWLMWPEGLMIVPAAIYLIGIRALTLDDPRSSTRVRLLAFFGLFATASLVLLGTRPNLYTIIAVPVIPDRRVGQIAYLFNSLRRDLSSCLDNTICLAIHAMNDRDG